MESPTCCNRHSIHRFPHENLSSQVAKNNLHSAQGVYGDSMQAGPGDTCGRGWQSSVSQKDISCSPASQDICLGLAYCPSPTSQEDICASQATQGDRRPTSQEDICASQASQGDRRPTSQEDICASPTSQGDRRLSPTSQEDVCASLSGLGDHCPRPTGQEDICASPTSQGGLSPSPVIEGDIYSSPVIQENICLNPASQKDSPASQKDFCNKDNIVGPILNKGPCHNPTWRMVNCYSLKNYRSDYQQGINRRMDKSYRQDNSVCLGDNNDFPSSHWSNYREFYWLRSKPKKVKSPIRSGRSNLNLHLLFLVLLLVEEGAEATRCYTHIVPEKIHSTQVSRFSSSILVVLVLAEKLPIFKPRGSSPRLKPRGILTLEVWYTVYSY
jgi:hypothetical protein